MTQFEQYRWEDRVLHKGRWKLNLAVGAVAFAVLTGDCFDSGGRSWAGHSSLPQSDNGASVTELDVPRRGAAAPEYLDRSVGTFWLMNTHRSAM